MTEINIESVANQIIKEYRKLAGHTMTPSVSEYIEIRKQAILEIGAGIYKSDPEQADKEENRKQNNPKEKPETKPQKIKQPEKSPEYEYKEPYTKAPSTTRKETADKRKEEKPKNVIPVAEERPQKSDFEILRGLKDEWN